MLVHLYGTQVLTEPWNPYMPVMWWPLTLVAVWAVLDDDLAMLPVAVFAGSFCMQTHISYLGIVAGIAALAVVALALGLAAAGRPAGPGGWLAWSAPRSPSAVVLWLPPLIDQVTNDPGNASVVLDHFLEAEDEPIGVAAAPSCSPSTSTPGASSRGGAISGSVVPGLLLVAVWAAAAVHLAPAPGAGDAAAATRCGCTSCAGAGARAGLGHAHPGLRLALPAAVGLGHHDAHAGRRGLERRAGRPPGEPGDRPARHARAALAVVVLVGWTAVFAAGSRDAQPTPAPGVRGGGDVTAPLLAAIDRGDVTRRAATPAT